MGVKPAFAGEPREGGAVGFAEAAAGWAGFGLSGGG